MAHGGRKHAPVASWISDDATDLHPSIATAAGEHSIREPHRTAKDVLTTQYDGYLLAVPSKEIDVSEFKRLTKSGFAAFDAGDDYEASVLLDRALALWRDRVLADLPVGPGAGGRDGIVGIRQVGRS